MKDERTRNPARPPSVRDISGLYRDCVLENPPISLRQSLKVGTLTS